MKYVLIDRGDNIIDRVNLDGDLQEAQKFFIHRKNIDKKEFNNIWRVLTDEQYQNQFKSTLHNKQYEWWKDEDSYLDIDK